MIARQRTKHRVGLIFSIGVAPPQGSSNFTLHEMAVQEQAVYHDLLIGSYEDRYDHLTYKTIANLQWAARRCSSAIPFFLFIDVDHGVDIDQLLSVLAKLPQSEREVAYYGSVTRFNTVKRDPKHKHFTKKTDIPWPYHHDFNSGCGIVLGAQLVKELSIGAAYVKPLLNIEDVYLGMTALKLGVKPKQLPRIFNHEYNIPSGVKPIIAPIPFFL